MERQPEPAAAAVRPEAPVYEPPVLTFVGRVVDLIQGGGGKLSVSGSDPGDTRKPSGAGH
jgi:hypothetical protein